MQLFRTYRNLIVGALLGALVVFVVSDFVTNKRLSQLRSSLDVSVENEARDVIALAKLIGEGGFTKSAESTIVDCSQDERELFETRLGQLDSGLTKAELAEIDFLFSRCAPVQSVRRALMMIDFSRQLESLDSLINQRKQVGDFTRYDKELADLKTLAYAEEEITKLSLDLVYLQRQILDLLLAGKSVEAEEFDDLRTEGSLLRKQIHETAIKAQEVRVRVVTP